MSAESKSDTGSDLGAEVKTKNAVSDKIPSAHSDLIIALILSRSDELFADNRKRKPVFNARRKAKWKELVENLNKQIGAEYSVERVKNNYHYRVTSLKRNVGRQLSELPEGEDVSTLPSFQQLSEIDKMLFEAIRSVSADGVKTAVRRKKARTERTEPSESEPKMSFDILGNSPPSYEMHSETPALDRVLAELSAPIEETLIPEGEEPSLKQCLLQMAKTHSDTLSTLRLMIADHSHQQQKLAELMSATTTLLRESAASLERFSNPPPCPTCTGNFIEALIQTYGTAKDPFDEHSQ